MTRTKTYPRTHVMCPPSFVGRPLSLQISGILSPSARSLYIPIHQIWQRCVLPKYSHVQHQHAGPRSPRLPSCEIVATHVPLPRSSVTRKNPFAPVAENAASRASTLLPNALAVGTTGDQTIPQMWPRPCQNQARLPPLTREWGHQPTSFSLLRGSIRPTIQIYCPIFSPLRILHGCRHSQP